MTSSTKSPLFIGSSHQTLSEQEVRGNYVTLSGEPFYKIQNYDAMDPFFLSVVSASNHWLFLSSTGGLSAGRVSAEQALFPYYTEDKLAENSDHSGNKAILLVKRGRHTFVWEPFSNRQQGVYQIERAIYKNVTGNTVIFEENNLSLNFSYRYAWRTSDAFGFVKTTWLANLGKTSSQVELIDGLQNLLPANVTSTTQNTFSCLLDAYKRGELDPRSGLAIFALNSTLSDLAEPSESLLATTVFQLGLDSPTCLLSSKQLDAFRTGSSPQAEHETRGRRCAYFVHTQLSIAAGKEKSWHLVAEVSQDSSAIVHLANSLRANRAALLRALEGDLQANRASLESIVAASDGLQLSRHALLCAHHFANVLFNGMRGGVFADQYRLDLQDFREFLAVRNRDVLAKNAAVLASLPATLDISALLSKARASGSSGLLRLGYSYLPLSFSRRHGDPSRPWNRFAINLKKPDGSKQLDYEGNWRDIFQNWEALSYSYPEYVESMICTFLNATSADGYNPYRITRQGVEWEIPEPHNPWANIGYWSDHQIIYLQKLMEISVRMHPGRLQDFLTQALFSYANVPYHIKPYADLLKDPYNSIDFDWELQGVIDTRVKNRGTDGKLVYSSAGEVLQVNLAEKLLTLLLAKLANFVPEGGIWMNTQRPEWNDANNALVGKGLSVVTLCYLRRTMVFFRDLLVQSAPEALAVSQEVGAFFAHVHQILRDFQDGPQFGFSDSKRRAMLDALGQAGEAYRANLYTRGFSGEQIQLPANEWLSFLDLALKYAEHSLRANQRADHLYHAYNILHFGEGSASVSHLYEMLEGQVAILSSGMLNGAESLQLLDSLRASPLYRADQHTYILYPDREVKGFLVKNSMPASRVQGLALVRELVKNRNGALITRDEDGSYHFNGRIRNGKDVNLLLSELQRDPRYASLVEAEASQVKALFEEVFHHDEFTGRSGTFFAYEGLGSIYWHMVSKLLLAVQETIVRTQAEPTTPALLVKYADIRKGQCFNKTPAEYGAFPTDPYSHTPKGGGARQPGMTGMVKEEILARLTELGLSIENGLLAFHFLLFNQDELLDGPSVYAYQDVHGQPGQIELPAHALAYSICQVPIILQSAAENALTVFASDGSQQKIEGHLLDAASTCHIFQRDGAIHHLVVSFSANR